MKGNLWLFLGIASFGLHDYLIMKALQQGENPQTLVIAAVALSPLLMGWLVSRGVRRFLGQGGEI
jgi:hypothetical protein